MEDEESFLEDLFDKLLKDYLLLEKNIYESYTSFENNPSEEMRELLGNVCTYARLQITTLLKLLPRVCTGELLNNYEQKLEIKMNELFAIRDRISNQHDKS